MPRPSHQSDDSQVRTLERNGTFTGNDSFTENGTFTISLDFELFWGMACVAEESEYAENLAGTPAAVRGMLGLFAKHEIHATWATVGFLFLKSKQELLANAASERPNYETSRYGTYRLFDRIDSQSAANYFAPELIAEIDQTPHQEIATHTLSHYYCLEKGQTESEFAADLAGAVAVAKKSGVELKSIVFPRNQFNEAYLATCKSLGIENVRGTPTHSIYQPSSHKTNWLASLRRFSDAYVNLTGYHSFVPTRLNGLVNVPGSRFLRPYTPSLRLFENAKLRRIKNEMTEAAKNGKIYHLWWHPHNFGRYTEMNLLFLERILKHFHELKTKFNFQSRNMHEIGTSLKSQG